MSSLLLEAVVIGNEERARSSRLVQLFSRQGLHYALVSGSEIQGPFRFLWSDLITLFHKVEVTLEKRRDFWIIKEGQVLERYPDLRRSYISLETAQKMRKSIKKVARQELAIAPLYETFLAHLQMLCSGFDELMVLQSFFAKLLYLEGYLDSTRAPACHACQTFNVELWNSQGHWMCKTHKLSGEYWSVEDQTLLLTLVHNRKKIILQEKATSSIEKLLEAWIDSL